MVKASIRLTTVALILLIVIGSMLSVVRAVEVSKSERVSEEKVVKVEEVADKNYITGKKEKEKERVEVDKKAVIAVETEETEEEIIAKLNKIVEESMIEINTSLSIVINEEEAEIEITNNNKHLQILEVYIEDKKIIEEEIEIGEIKRVAEVKEQLEKGLYEGRGSIISIDKEGLEVARTGLEMEIIVR